MSQPYPSLTPPAPPVAVEQPSSVRTAVRLMYLGAVLSVASAAAALSGRRVATATLRRQFPNLTAQQAHAFHDAVTISAVVGGIIGIAAWIWMAWAIGHGRNWARIVGAVFFGLDTLGLLSLLRGRFGLAGLVITVAIWLTGLAVIILIFQAQSRPFFRPVAYPAAGYQPPYPPQSPYQQQPPPQQQQPQQPGAPPAYQQPPGAPRRTRRPGSAAAVPAGSGSAAAVPAGSGPAARVPAASVPPAASAAARPGALGVGIVMIVTDCPCRRRVIGHDHGQDPWAGGRERAGWRSPGAGVLRDVECGGGRHRASGAGRPAGAVGPAGAGRGPGCAGRPGRAGGGRPASWR